jgi:uncharacterized protein YjiS (DUF1127 family)
MANYDISRPAGTAFGGRILGVAASALHAVAAWNNARITRNSLSRLSDRELDDIGLSRGDIENIAAGRYTRF